ncbi:MAG TPA: CAP domain-containing protein [Spirochaetaceae bacterium]|nr:CAP domain-containing protein [Spirochaetaceae bacterium]
MIPDNHIIAVRNGNFDPASPNGLVALEALVRRYPPAASAAPSPPPATTGSGTTLGSVTPAAVPGTTLGAVIAQPAATPAAIPAATPTSTPPSSSPTPASATPAATNAPTVNLNGGLTNASFVSQLELEVVAELNLARTNPRAYAQLLRDYRGLIRGNFLERPGEIRIQLQEGAHAVDEAIAALERQTPVPAMSLSRGLSRAAADHAADQARSGAVGHTGSDRSTMSQRISRYGQWQRSAGENIAYGPHTARDIVIQLIVDDGVPSRGHRENIFNPAFLVVGVAFDSHQVYGTVCVQDFAGGYSEQ